MKRKHNIKEKLNDLIFSVKLLIVLTIVHIFTSFFSILDMLYYFFKIEWYFYIFHDSEFNIRFGSYWDLAIQYSKRMWLFIPITILIFTFTIYNNIKNFKTKYKHRVLILTISVIILILVAISTIGCCYEWYDYWASESV